MDAGWAALGRGDWAGARTAFEGALADGETPEALEGIGWAGHMLSEDRLTIDARERAYRQYLDRGDRSSAARIASLLAADCLMFRGEAAVANGWLQRAHSLIDDLEPGVDHGWLAIHEGHIAVSLTEDTAKARQLAAQAVELGARSTPPSWRCSGWALRGARWLATASWTRACAGSTRRPRSRSTARRGCCTASPGPAAT